MTFSKKTTPPTPLHSTHSTYLFKIFFSLLTLSTAFLQKACGPGKNKVHNVNQHVELDLMMCNVHFYKFCPKIPLHLPIQNILLAVNPFHCFFCKKTVDREKYSLLVKLFNITS